MGETANELRTPEACHDCGRVGVPLICVYFQSEVYDLFCQDCLEDREQRAEQEQNYTAGLLATGR